MRTISFLLGLCYLLRPGLDYWGVCASWVRFDLRTTRKDATNGTIMRLSRPETWWSGRYMQTVQAPRAGSCPSMPLHGHSTSHAIALKTRRDCLTGRWALRLIRCLGLLVGDFKGVTEQLDAAGHCVKIFCFEAERQHFSTVYQMFIRGESRRILAEDRTLSRRSICRLSSGSVVVCIWAHRLDGVRTALRVSHPTAAQL